MRRKYRYHNTCNRCGCPLDAGEGLYCEECQEERYLEYAYAKKWKLTAEQVRELKAAGMEL